MSMRHVILTRLGIGIARPTFYAQHIAFLEAGLLKSMKAQSCQNFEWYVCVDRQIDTHSRKKLQALLGDDPRFYLLLVDPLTKGHISPRYRDLPAKDGNTVLMTRIDDDDALHKNSMQLLQDQARYYLKNETSFTMGFSNGLRIDPGQKKYAALSDSTRSVGLTSVFPAEAPIDIYGFNHAQVKTIMQQKGCSHHSIDTLEPMWIYTRRSTSDSGSEKTASKKFVPFDAVTDVMVRNCGLSGSWADDINVIETALVDFPAPLIDTTMRRLQMKNVLLKEIRTLKKENKKNTDTYRALVAGFYAI